MPEIPARDERPRYRPDIDGLRAVAVTMVIAYHVGLPHMLGGFVGVDVFFVISGYLIVGLLHRELSRSGHVRWWAFFARRVRRLVPAAVVMTIAVLAAGALILNPVGEQQLLARSAIASSLSASNIYFWRVAHIGYFVPPGALTPVLGHTWSLGVEEQFYLALPLAVWTAHRLARRAGWTTRRALLCSAVALTVASLATSVWWGNSHVAADFYSPVTRAYEFGVGALLALATVEHVARRLVRLAVGAAGLATLVVCIVRPLPMEGFPGAWGLIPVLATAAVLWSGETETVVSRVLSLAPAVAVGRVSYGWYLWHLPLLALAAAWNLAPVSLGARIVLALAALLVAVASYRWVERRFRQLPYELGARLSPPRITVVLGVGTLGLCVGLSGLVGLHARSLAQGPIWSQVQSELMDVPVLPDVCVPDPANVMGDAQTACRLSDWVPGRATVVIWGDSHAWQFVPALQRAVAGRDVNLVSWTAGGCPPFIPLPVTPTGDVPASSQDALDLCVTHNRLAWRDISSMSRSGQPLRLVLSARWDPYLGERPLSLADQPTAPGSGLFVTAFAQELRVGLGSLAARARESSIPVTLVASTPELERSAPLCLAQRWTEFDCAVSRDALARYQTASRSLLEEQLRVLPSGSRLLDVTPELCDEQLCRAETDGIVNYFDDDHLSAARAETLAPAFVPTIRALERSARVGAARSGLRSPVHHMGVARRVFEPQS